MKKLNLRASCFALCFVLSTVPILAQAPDASGGVIGDLHQKLTQADGTIEKDHACVAHQISCGQTINTRLSLSSCLTDDGFFGNVYRFQGQSGQTVTVDMMSSSFDTILGLVNPAGNVVAASDDDGAGSNSRIVHQLNQTSSQWALVTSSFFAFTTGPYSLRLQCSGQTPPPPPGGDTSPCVAGEFTICAVRDRFEVTATSERSLFPGQAGRVSPTFDADLGGAFHFFLAEQNFQAVVKVSLRPSGYYAVAAASIGGLPWTITIRDTLTGQVEEYTNVSGGLGVPTDPRAFLADP